MILREILSEISARNKSGRRSMLFDGKMFMKLTVWPEEMARSKILFLLKIDQMTFWDILEQN